jgi:hypothetical protein
MRFNNHSSSNDTAATVVAALLRLLLGSTLVSKSRIGLDTTTSRLGRGRGLLAALLGEHALTVRAITLVREPKVDYGLDGRACAELWGQEPCSL